MSNEKIQLNVPSASLVPLIEEQLSEGKTVKFAPKGTSMLPLLREGRDTVTLCAINRPLEKYDIGFYRRQNGQYVLHRIVDIKDTVTCCGDGQFWLEKGLLPSQFIGVVCAFSRDNKTYSVTSWSYKFYCRIIHFSRPLRHFISRATAKLKKILKGG
ncbi:MAG: hypothetical protein E7560_05665 [Ruminococcaceae bacterium]|nr:hypothetical protein [Oscillospiraceae bacterium]